MREVCQEGFLDGSSVVNDGEAPIVGQDRSTVDGHRRDQVGLDQVPGMLLVEKVEGRSRRRVGGGDGWCCRRLEQVEGRFYGRHHGEVHELPTVVERHCHCRSDILVLPPG